MSRANRGSGRLLGRLDEVHSDERAPRTPLIIGKPLTFRWWVLPLLVLHRHPPLPPNSVLPRLVLDVPSRHTQARMYTCAACECMQVSMCLCINICRRVQRIFCKWVFDLSACVGCRLVPRWRTASPTTIGRQAKDDRLVQKGGSAGARRLRPMDHSLNATDLLEADAQACMAPPFYCLPCRVRSVGVLYVGACGNRKSDYMHQLTVDVRGNKHWWEGGRQKVVWFGRAMRDNRYPMGDTWMPCPRVCLCLRLRLCLNLHG